MIIQVQNAMMVSRIISNDMTNMTNCRRVKYLEMSLNTRTVPSDEVDLRHL